MESINTGYNMSYITNEDWTKYFLPKLSDDKLFLDELKQIIKIQNLLLGIIELIFLNSKTPQNKLKQHILYSSMIYSYKYYTYNNISYSTLCESEKLINGTSCIFLSFKEARKCIDINYITDKIQPYLNKQLNGKNKLKNEDINNLIIQKEFDILNSIEFNMGIDNPYEFLSILKLYLQEIHIENNTINEIIELTNKYNNDSILFPLYLYYTSYEIALSCILLVKENKKYNFIDINNIIKLCKLDIDVNNIYQCSKYISKITEALKSLQKNISDDNLKPISEKNSENYLNFNTISIINTN